MNDILFQVSIWAVPVILAVTLHEAAHGWVAWRLGDPTAKMLGRVSFNPLRHIDPFGTVLMPAMMLLFSGGAMMFGYAKPVPVNVRRLRSPRRDMVLVAAAGPGMNFLMAVVAAWIFSFAHLLPQGADQWVAYNLLNLTFINLILGIFNLMPLPPLDGGRIAVGLLPRQLAMPLARLERFGIFIVLGILFILPEIGKMIGVDLHLFWWLVGAPAQYILSLLLF